MKLYFDTKSHYWNMFICSPLIALMHLAASDNQSRALLYASGFLDGLYIQWMAFITFDALAFWVVRKAKKARAT
jgi:hypothetical protein